MVLAETAWVLERALRMPKADVVKTLETLLATAHVEFEHPETVRRALDDFRSGKGDLPDYLLMRDNERAGCETTLTYDRAAARHPGFTLVP